MSCCKLVVKIAVFFVLLSPSTLAMQADDAGQVKAEDLTVGTGTVTVAAGDTISIPVTIFGSSTLAKTVALSCLGLPKETACQYAPGTVDDGTVAMLRISTSAPRDCGSSTPYGVPAKAALLPGILLLIARRRGDMKRLLTLACVALTLGSITGCGIGNCTDIGTLPGTYIVTVMGNAAGTQVSQKVTLVVTP